MSNAYFFPQKIQNFPIRNVVFERFCKDKFYGRERFSLTNRNYKIAKVNEVKIIPKASKTECGNSRLCFCKILYHLDGKTVRL